jgi:hypothetical protein
LKKLYYKPTYQEGQRAKLMFSGKLKSNLTVTLLIMFLIISICFGSGIIIGFKSVKYKPQIFKFLVSSSIYRYFVLKNTASETTANYRSDLKEVACPTTYLAIASFGQSNAANRVPREGGAITIEDGKTFMWDWTSGKCYPYSEPVVGTDGNGANILTDTILQLKTKYSGNLLMVAFARGGSSVFDWSHVRLSVRLDNVLQRLKKHAIEPKIFFWHQGESDGVTEVYVPWKINAYGQTRGSVSHYYEKALSLIIQKTHEYFPRSTIGVALVSICGNDGNPLIINAQKNVADKYPYVKISSNTDMLGNEYRADDGCHFNELGKAKIGKDYSHFINQWLEKKGGTN